MIPSVWREKEVAVIGLGRTGRAVGRWLAGEGVGVYASDADSNAELEAHAAKLRGEGVAVDLGAHDLARIRNAAAVITSPGVPPNASPLLAAREASVEVVAELDVAARVLSEIPLVAVTGTNGKTTTTALIAHVLNAAGLSVEAAGNIGKPLIELAGGDLSLDWVVVEVSSFQLHDSPNLAPRLGVFTNLAPDHLDRYQSVDEYYQDKRLFFQNASDDSRWIFPADDQGVLDLAGDVPGGRKLWSTEQKADAWWDRDSGHLVVHGQRLIRRDAVPLLGDHNVANVLAALLVAAAVGVDMSVASSSLQDASPQPHRLEVVREVAGAVWINDSKATNVAAASVGLRAMDGPVIWLVGGKDKNQELDSMFELLGRCHIVLAFGEVADKFCRAFERHAVCEKVTTLAEAVSRAKRHARVGDVVLLSPACASFDQFKNYEERGDVFRELVNAI